MSSVVTFTVQATTEALRVTDLGPHLKRWKGMKRVTDRQWEFEGGRLVLSYEGRLGGADLVNTLRFSADSPDLKAYDRIMKLGEWLSDELGWPLTTDIS
jgi:hypothetical protein